MLPTLLSVPIRKRKRTFWPARLVKFSWVAVYPKLGNENARLPPNGFPKRVERVVLYWAPATIKDPASVQEVPPLVLYSITPQSKLGSNSNEWLNCRRAPLAGMAISLLSVS